MVRLIKGDNWIDLSTPMGYIDYKILLTNRDFICPSEEELKRKPKYTYQYVITTENEQLGMSIADLTNKSRAYRLFGEIEQDVTKMAYICEKVAGKTIHIQNRDMILDTVNKMILSNAKGFIKECENKYLDTEILIRKAVDRGIIRKYKTEYTLVSRNLTLCAAGLNPTLRTACEFLNLPKNQEILFEITAQVDE